MLALALCLPQGSLILCASEDGHLALEALCDPGNADAHAEAPPAEDAGGCDCDSDCGPCQDSQVGTQLTAGRIRDDSARAADLDVAPALLPAGFALAQPLAPARRTAPAVPPDPFARVQAGVCLRL